MSNKISYWTVIVIVMHHVVVLALKRIHDMSGEQNSPGHVFSNKEHKRMISYEVQLCWNYEAHQSYNTTRSSSSFCTFLVNFNEWLMLETYSFWATGESTISVRPPSLKSDLTPKPFNTLEASKPNEILNLRTLKSPTSTFLYGRCLFKKPDWELTYVLKLEARFLHLEERDTWKIGVRLVLVHMEDKGLWIRQKLWWIVPSCWS